MGTMKNEYTLQELLQTALGGPKITNFNLWILHSLIDIILKKLNCQYETVTNDGFQSTCLEELLRHSRMSPLVFKSDKIRLVSSKLEKLSKLEARLKVVDRNLEKHFEDIRKCNSRDDHTFESIHWERFSKVCEDMCTIPTPENAIACKLICSALFGRRLRYLLGNPLTEYVMGLEKKCDELHVRLLDFSKAAKERYKKIAIIDSCIIELELLRQQIKEEERRFARTIQEIHVMLKTKLTKIHLTGLKFYIKHQYDQMADIADKLKRKAACPKNTPAHGKQDGMKCLSCGGVKTCSVTPFHLPKSPDLTTFLECQGLPPFCGCNPVSLCREHEEALVQHMRKKKAEEALRSKEPQLTCRKDITVFEGFDGSFYRKG